MAVTPQSATVLPFRSREHLAQVLEFQYEVYERNFPGFVVDREFLQDYERQLRQAERSPAEGIWVVEEQERVLAFLWAAVISTMVDEKLGYIKNVYVVPERRGQGLAEVLIHHAEDWMLSLGIERCALDVTAGNHAAVHLYQRCGYRTTRYRMEKELRGEEATS